MSTLIVQCYMCEQEDSKENTMELPTTTGETVYSHPKCFERYMQYTTSSQNACGGCSGNKGCC
ncbi:MAG: hypothetical protein INQ03_23360 [Candidatus Heimdallarchaeota archaeon]|nr:hypothetical protein [Candidatus Heimdallarchaeota archaeon]